MYPGFHTICGERCPYCCVAIETQNSFFFKILEEQFYNFSDVNIGRAQCKASTHISLEKGG